MVEIKENLESLVEKMMIDSETGCKEDKVYQEDMKSVGILKVQWKICGIQGYQIFNIDKIPYKLGESLEDPDVTLETDDKDLSIRLLLGEHFDFDYGIDNMGNFQINHTVGLKTVETDKGKTRVRTNKPFITARFNKEKRYHPFILSKIPIFRNFVTQRLGENDYGAYIPINQSLGKIVNEVVPYKIFKHFIDKASHIVMLKDCPCRMVNGCQEHDKMLGCIHMGTDTLELQLTKDRGEVATKQEALERVKLAIDDGLIPILGRAMDEAEGFGVPDTGHFLSMCFCCSCCCINGVIATYASQSLSIFSRMEGITVKTDEDLCAGCGDCLEVCTFKGMEMIGEIAKVNQARCLGCGRCVNTCPNEAISINIDDPGRVDELIKKIESHVEVS